VHGRDVGVEGALSHEPLVREGERRVGRRRVVPPGQPPAQRRLELPPDLARVEQIEFDAYGVGTEWPDLLQTELGDRATVTRTTVDGRLRNFNSLIESINHDLTPNSWHVSMDLSPGISGNFFTLGVSLLGGTDVLYY
jgi:hypothetical protein